MKFRHGEAVAVKNYLHSDSQDPFTLTSSLAPGHHLIWVGKWHCTSFIQLHKLPQRDEFNSSTTLYWVASLACSSESFQLSSPAPMLSTNCSIFLAPMTTELTVSWCNNHFKATCGTLLATVANTSRIANYMKHQCHIMWYLFLQLHPLERQ